MNDNTQILAATFARQYERFCVAVLAHKDSKGIPFQNFQTGLPHHWESYKEHIYLCTGSAGT